MKRVQANRRRTNTVCEASYEERRLLNALLADYNIMERPVADSKDSLTVMLDMNLIHVTKLVHLFIV